MPTGIYPRTNKHKYWLGKKGYWSKKKRWNKKNPHPKGMLGKPAWNKGLTKEIDKRIKKYSEKVKGKSNSRWKGGKIKVNGYIRIYFPEHPFCHKKHPYVFEHRLVMEKYLKRYLKPEEIIHHKNSNKEDNHIENLALVVKGKNWHPQNCPKCGFEFLIK